MRIKTEHRAVLVLVLLVLLLAGVKTYAHSSGGLRDSSQLPETRGTVRQYTLTPRGDVDGLILNDGTEVKIPPHLTGQIVFSIRPGDTVTVHGLTAKAAALVDAAAITNDASGRTIVDNGPPGPNPVGAETVSGRVVLLLHGKRGEINGALLENGTTVRLPPPEADRMHALLQPGQTVAIRGGVLTTVLGTVINATAIGSSPNDLSEFVDAPSRGQRDRARPGPYRPDAFGPSTTGFGNEPPTPPRI